jgi:hypothetical protein
MANPSTRNKILHKARHKIQTRKVMDRLTYCPKKHKQRFVKTMRQQLQRKVLPASSKPLPPPTHIKFGSFNVNGLDLESCWAVQELLEKRGFDVSFLF